MKNTLIKLVLVSQLFYGVSYADPANVVYNNGPVGGDGGAGVAMERLRATEKELERYRVERNVAVAEMNYRIKEDESRWSPVTYIIIGLVAGGAGAYFGTKK